MPEPSSVPKGLVFFAPGASPGYRRRRIAVVAVCILGFLAVIWPVAALVAGPRPLVLAMPLALAWIVFWLLVVFVALLWLYRSEDDAPPPDPS